MAIPSSLSLSYDAVLSTTLFNYRRTLSDNISKSNKFFYMLKKTDGWKTVSALGDRLQVPLMYELGTADSYSGYDQLDVTPMDGITSAFFDWRQASIPIAISGMEEKKNTGEAQILNLLKSKVKQAELGLEDYFNKAVLQGNESTAITTAKTSALNGSVFVDPLPLLVTYDPTSSTSIGNINQATYTWWANQTKTSSGASYAAIEKELKSLYNLCSKGGGGAPNMNLVDVNTYELYEAILAVKHRNLSYKEADVPFDHVNFKGSPVFWDEYVPNASGATVTLSTTAGSWWMLNTQFLSMSIHAGTNFTPTPFVKPENQDAKVAHIMVIAALAVSNRRKQGVAGAIDTTVTS